MKRRNPHITYEVVWTDGTETFTNDIVITGVTDPSGLPEPIVAIKLHMNEAMGVDTEADGFNIISHELVTRRRIMGAIVGATAWMSQRPRAVRRASNTFWTKHNTKIKGLAFSFAGWGAIYAGAYSWLMVFGIEGMALIFSLFMMLTLLFTVVFALISLMNTETSMRDDLESVRDTVREAVRSKGKKAPAEAAPA